MNEEFIPSVATVALKNGVFRLWRSGDAELEDSGSSSSETIREFDREDTREMYHFFQRPEVQAYFN